MGKQTGLVDSGTVVCAHACVCVCLSKCCACVALVVIPQVPPTHQVAWLACQWAQGSARLCLPNTGLKNVRCHIQPFQVASGV